MSVGNPSLKTQPLMGTSFPQGRSHKKCILISWKRNFWTFIFKSPIIAEFFFFFNPKLLYFMWLFWGFSWFQIEIALLFKAFRACAVLCFVAQLSLTLCNPMDYSPPGSFVHGDSSGKNTGVGCHALLQGIFTTQGPKPGLPHRRQILYSLSHQGSPFSRA